MLSATGSEESAASRTHRVIIESQDSQSTNSEDQNALASDLGPSEELHGEGASADVENIAEATLNDMPQPHVTQPLGPGVMQPGTPLLVEVPNPTLPASTNATGTRQEERPGVLTPSDIWTQDEIQRVPNSTRPWDEPRNSSCTQ